MKRILKSTIVVLIIGLFFAGTAIADLTATITKFSVEKRPGLNDFICTINVEVVNESAVVLFNNNYSEKYNSSTSLDSIKQKFQDAFVADWNEFASEKVILDATAFDTLVSDLQATANAFINQ